MMSYKSGSALLLLFTIVLTSVASPNQAAEIGLVIQKMSFTIDTTNTLDDLPRFTPVEEFLWTVRYFLIDVQKIFSDNRRSLSDFDIQNQSMSRQLIFPIGKEAPLKRKNNPTNK